MHRNRLILFTVTLLAMVGCNQPNGFNRVMNQADSIMEADQDNAKKSLVILDKMKPQLSEISKAQRMRYNLLYAKAMNKGNVDFTSDSIMKDVTTYYDYHGSDYEKMTAHYLLGCAYRDLGDAPTALRCLNEAVEYAGHKKASYKMLAHIHGQIADLLHKQALIGNEICELDSAYHYAMLAGDTVDAIAIYNIKSDSYSMINKLDSAAIINERAVKMYKSLHYMQFAAQISTDCIDYYIQHKKYAKAKACLDFYEKYSGYFHYGEIESGREVFYYTKGQYYASTNKYDSAEHYFRKCLLFKDDLNMANAGYHGLSLLYQKMGKADSAAKYAIMAYSVNDSNYQISAAEALLRQQEQYNYSKHQADALQSAQKTESLQRWLLGLTFTVILLVLISYYIYTRRKRIIQQRIALMRERYETEKALLQNEMQELYALLEKRQTLLDDKDNLLQHKQEELNSEIDKREKSIAQLQKRVLDYEREMNMKDMAEQEDKIQNTHLKECFSIYLKKISAHPSAKEWDKLSKFAKKDLPKLYFLLNNYKASERDFRICILTRLNFKPKDVAVIAECSLSEVSQARSRLLMKIYGIEGKPSDFDNRIMLMH